MIVAAKKIAYRLLDRAGYRLVKTPEYEMLLATGGHRRFASVSGGSLAGDDLAADRVQALRSAVRYLLNAGIAGSIVDCGYGSTATLAALAQMLAEHGDIARQLVLFDSSADPTHCAEPELRPWGLARECLADCAPAGEPRLPEAPPPEFIATGYPVGNIAIRRYPREPIACAGPVAFLGLTAESYEANRACIAAFVPLVTPGGVIAIDEGNGLSRNAADEFFAQRRMVLGTLAAARNYRIGTLP
jgi:hypothetical protein